MINLMHPERCSNAHWMQLGMLLVVAGVFTVCASRVTNLHNDDLDMKGNSVKFAAMAFLAGFRGGFLGIGGGLVMGPVLLELGLLPEVGQATTALFVLLSSSLGTAQFVLLGKEMPYFVLWYTFWVAVSTIAGQMMSDRIVRVYKRTSFIVFAVCGVGRYVGGDDDLGRSERCHRELGDGAEHGLQLRERLRRALSAALAAYQ